MGTIFIAGIHGVGKSTLCEKISSELGIDAYSAGDLISQINDESYGPNKTATDPEQNQKILVKQVKAILSQTKRILLAGHFCVLDEKLQVNKLSTKVFDELEIEMIILLETSAKRVFSNLYNRDRKLYEENIIKEMLDIEKELAMKVSKERGVNLLVHSMNYNDSDVKECLDYINGG